MLQDEIQLGIFFNNWDDLASNLLGQHHHFDIFVVFEAVTDNRGVVIGDGQDGEQFGFRSRFKPEFVGLPVFEYFLNNLALLVDLDRVNAAVVPAVSVLGDRRLKRLAHLTEPVFENLAKADEQGQGDAAKLEIINQLLEINATARILVGMDPKVPILPD